MNIGRQLAQDAFPTFGRVAFRWQLPAVRPFVPGDVLRDLPLVFAAHVNPAGIALLSSSGTSCAAELWRLHEARRWQIQLRYCSPWPIHPRAAPMTQVE
jgi:hypothetical protein